PPPRRVAADDRIVLCPETTGGHYWRRQNFVFDCTRTQSATTILTTRFGIARRATFTDPLSTVAGFMLLGNTARNIARSPPCRVHADCRSDRSVHWIALYLRNRPRSAAE